MRKKTLILCAYAGLKIMYYKIYEDFFQIHYISILLKYSQYIYHKINMLMTLA